VSFNPYADTSIRWQYAAERIVAEKAYNSIRVMMVYEDNVNKAYFDGLHLYKEEFGYSYVYDEDGNVKSATDARSASTTYAYADNGVDLTQMNLPGGASYEYTYDSWHNVKTSESATGNKTAMDYDEYGNATRAQVKSKNSSETAVIQTDVGYTSDGNYTSSITDSAREISYYSYDGQTGELDWVRAPGEGESTQTNYTYDELHRLTGVSKAMDETTTVSANYTYTNDRLSTLTHSNGSGKSTQYTFSYNAFGLPTTTKVGGNTLATNRYSADRLFLLQQLEYGNGNTVNYTYDDLGRQTGAKYNDMSNYAYTYTYDSDGNIATVTDNLQWVTTRYSYDMAGRLGQANMRSNAGVTVNDLKWTYDDRANITGLNNIVHGTLFTTNYEYDADNRLTRSYIGSINRYQTYDNYGRLKKSEIKWGTADRETTTITYKTEGGYETNQVASWTNSANNGYTKSYNYGYDSKGNITSIASDNKTTRYSYDSLGQLIREDNQAAGKTWTYTYDGGGNLLTKSEYAHTTASTLGAADSTISYGYEDSNWYDKLTSYKGSPVTSDAIGNITSIDGWNYTWQYGRQLASATNGTVTANFTYNADGQRATKNTGGSSTYYYYNGSQLVATVKDGVVTYIRYDANGTPLTIKYNNAEYFYLTNVQGDVVALMNNAGNVVVEYTYDAWGNPLSVTGSAATTLGAANPLRYRGYIYDE